MTEKMAKNAHSIIEALENKGIKIQIKTYPSSTRTAEDAAKSIECDVAQIAKSLIFKTKSTNKPILVLTSGVNRVNEKVLQHLVGEKISKADAQFTREATGFAIGGIPPCGHKQDIQTFIDEDLFKHSVLWAAAGTPNTVFSLTPDQLKLITNGSICSIK